MIEHFKNIGLTDRDFDLIVEGLQILPNKNPIGNILGEAISKAMNSKSEDNFQVFELNMKDMMKKADVSRKDLTEEVTILQGKLLQLKRILKAENLMSKVDDILDGKYRPGVDEGGE